MTPTDGEICGTARLAMEAISAERSFRKALRAQARGRFVEAKALMASALSRWTVREIPVAAAESAQAAILFVTDDIAESNSLREKSAEAVRQWARELDETLAASRRSTNDDLMWLARSMAQRGLAAYLLGDYRAAEPFYRDAIATLAGIWGPDHLEVGHLSDECATLLLCMGKTAEAEVLIAQARAIVATKGFSYDTE